MSAFFDAFHAYFSYPIFFSHARVSCFASSFQFCAFVPYISRASVTVAPVVFAIKRSVSERPLPSWVQKGATVFHSSYTLSKKV